MSITVDLPITSLPQSVGDDRTYYLVGFLNAKGSTISVQGMPGDEWLGQNAATAFTTMEGVEIAAALVGKQHRAFEVTLEMAKECAVLLGKKALAVIVLVDGELSILEIYRVDGAAE